MLERPVVCNDLGITFVAGLSILGHVADGFAMGLLVTVDPVEPNLLLLPLFLHQRGLQVAGLYV